MGILQKLLGGFKGVMSQFPSIQIKDVVEILIITYIIYHILKWGRETKAWMLFKGVVVLGFISLIAFFLEFNTILWIFANTINVGIIAFFVLFQPELRRALEKLGQSNFLSGILNFEDHKNSKEQLSEEKINGIIQAVEEMAKKKTGVLIAIELEVSLAEYIRTGIILDAELSKELLINIFEHNSPLHDGAVIIRGRRIVAATCYLPLSENRSISKELGTRHRAGVGLSEVTDAIVIIVSEETGDVSMVINGNLARSVDQQYLKNKFMHFFGKKDDTKRYFLWKGFGKHGKNNNQ